MAGDAALAMLAEPFGVIGWLWTPDSTHFAAAAGRVARPSRDVAGGSHLGLGCSAAYAAPPIATAFRTMC